MAVKEQTCRLAWETGVGVLRKGEKQVARVGVNGAVRVTGCSDDPLATNGDNDEWGLVEMVEDFGTLGFEKGTEPSD